MRIVIAGCGRVGASLASQLADIGHDVSVIDKDQGAFAGLGSAFNGSTHIGMAYDVATLGEAGTGDADVFAAVTDSDNANMMAVAVAKELFGVPRTFARLDEPDREEAYRALDINFVAAARLVTGVLFEQIIEREFIYHITFPGGDVQVVELKLGDAAAGVKVEDFEVKDVLRVAAVHRDGETFVPRPASTLEAGDLVVAAARSGASAKVARYLAEEEAG